MLSDELKAEACELARKRGHKNVDELIVCSGGRRVPVWQFYLPETEQIAAALTRKE